MICKMYISNTYCGIRILVTPIDVIMVYTYLLQQQKIYKLIHFNIFILPKASWQLLSRYPFLHI